jgi:hypothetical protein
MKADRLELGQAAAAAQIEADQLARARLEPGMPLAGYLPPLQHLTDAILSASSTAARMAGLASLTIIDPAAGATAENDLKQAQRVSYQAAYECTLTIDVITRVLRKNGRLMPPSDGLPRLRRYKTTAEAAAGLDSQCSEALRDPPPLQWLEDPAGNLAAILDRLARAGDKLRAGVDDAYTRFPGARPRDVGAATDRITQAGGYLLKASGHASRAAEIISANVPAQRKAGEW